MITLRLDSKLETFNYKEALGQYLPIGSGEVESAHRYVIQDRLKITRA